MSLGNDSIDPRHREAATAAAAGNSKTLNANRRHVGNVGSGERWISAIAGVAIAAAGLRARSTAGLLGAAVGGGLIYRALSGHCPAYASLGIDTANHRDVPPRRYFDRGIHVEESVTVDRTPWDLYQFWRNFDNLPRIMAHVNAVDVIDEKHSHWSVDGPAGRAVEWDAEIINDEPNALIAWRSLAGATVDNAGSVRFVPGPAGRGTEVRVVIDYIPPAGRVGNWVATLLGKNPSSEIREDLGRFEQLMENQGAETA